MEFIDEKSHCGIGKGVARNGLIQSRLLSMPPFLESYLQGPFDKQDFTARRLSSSSRNRILYEL